MMEESKIIIGISIIFSLGFLSSIFYFLYQRIIRKNAYIDELEKKLHKLEKSISETTELFSLEPLLKKELMKIFGVKIAYLQMYSESENNWFFPAIRDFFHENREEWYFENSLECLNEIQDEWLRKKLTTLLPPDISYIFPIFSTQGFHIGNLILGEKNSWDHFISDEIEFLKEFSFFVEIHLKYIRTYALMHELSKVLDEKVDNKTMDYNNLLNRQKEFINVISHEVRSPLTSAIFQTETIIESLENPVLQIQKVEKELHELRDQLVRIGGLISKIFSVEYYDNQKVSLFLEVIHFPKFLEYEIELYSRIHPHITFLSNINPQIGFITIDKVQFQQVITNLLDNAVKFANPEDPLIFLMAEIQDSRIILTIEDNGKWLSVVAQKNIFDKYRSSWTNKNIWLWLGLYLCKKIVFLHHGTIFASNSEKYHGACFTITLPYQ